MKRLETAPQAQVIQVIEIVTSEGEGTGEEPVRQVVYYVSFDGRVLARAGGLGDEAWRSDVPLVRMR